MIKSSSPQYITDSVASSRSAGTPKLVIYVTCAKPIDNARLRSIREWASNSLRQNERECIGAIESSSSLDDALNRHHDGAVPSVLITLGFDPTQVRRALAGRKPSICEPIVCGIPFNAATADAPSASGLSQRKIVRASDVFAAIRKAIIRTSLRNSVTIRPLRTAADLQAHFDLRYRV